MQFLVGATPVGAVPTPEELSPEERALALATRAFVAQEALPRWAELEAGSAPALATLLARAAALGLAGLEVSERHGGLGLSVTAAMLVAAEVGRQPSLSTSLGAHFGLATLPVLLYGTEAARERYLPELARGTRLGAYALTEPEAGSDALAARSRAVRRAGGYVLDGQKQFITNAGIAGLYVVFARLEPDGHGPRCTARRASCAERSWPSSTPGAPCSTWRQPRRGRAAPPGDAGRDARPRSSRAMTGGSTTRLSARFPGATGQRSRPRTGPAGSSWSASTERAGLASSLPQGAATLLPRDRPPGPFPIPHGSRWPLLFRARRHYHAALHRGGDWRRP